MSIQLDNNEEVHVHINDPEPNEAQRFPSNFIRTAKYTPLDFLPRNLFEQFRRVSNIYFVLNMIFALIPTVSPVFPATSIFPVAFVLGVTAIKDAYEDYFRHQADKVANNAPQEVLRNGQFVSLPSKDIRVGDIVRVSKGHEIPADLVLLSSSADEGVCYIETSNLDGETNLKERRALPCTWGYNNEDSLHQARGRIVAEMAHQQIYEFRARLELGSGGSKVATYALSEKQLLLRGSRLRNTRWATGIVVYAGEDTKIFKNLRRRGAKFSTLDRRLNTLLVWICALQATFMIIAVAGNVIYRNTVVIQSFYLNSLISTPATGTSAILNFCTYFVLYSYMVPSSLFVTLELVKTAQAKFIEWDDSLMDKGRRMQVKSSSLNEELGQVQYVFSDKTGTLTENVMVFSKAHVCGVAGVHSESDAPGGLGKMMKDPKKSSHILEFLQCLACCHTVVPEHEEISGELVYEGQSPDESALVKGAAANDVTLLARSTSGISIDVQGTKQFFEILATLEFTSDRKRMSVVARLPNGQLRLYCKGADSHVLPLIEPSNAHRYQDEVLDKLDMFSRDGLRTLVIASRSLSDTEFNSWEQEFASAQAAIVDRTEKVEAVCSALEHNLELLGCTAIEDKLQDQVPESIEYLLKAGVVVWVLTGDKRETAINIAFSTRLLDRSMNVLQLAATDMDTCKEQLRSYLAATAAAEKEHDDISDRFALVTDGTTLKFALEKELSADFLSLCRKCKAAICCRVTPLQKAMVVRLVQDNLKVVGLSIGDGANDVTMIQEARIGVGIMGLEGTQAERAADYAVPRFHHLVRLITVHGRYSYVRYSSMVLYFAYKNLLLAFCQFHFGFFNLFSGQVFFDSWTTTFYNIIFTAIPPLVIGIFEKDASESIIQRTPELFKEILQGDLFSYKAMAEWLIAAVWHSSFIFFICQPLLAADNLFSDGRTSGLWLKGTIVLTLIITVATLKSAVHTRHWTKITLFAVLFSLLSYTLWLIIYSAFPNFGGYGNMYYVFYEMMLSPVWWSLVFLIVVTCIAPDLCLLYLRRTFWPKRWQILQEMEVSKDSPREMVERKLIRN